MKQLLIPIMSILLCTACKAQNTPMKTFDIEKYEQLKASGETEFYLDDGTYIKLFDAGGEGEFKNYIELIKPPKPEFFQSYSVYYYNGNIRVSGLQFPNDFEKGVWKEYDEDGRLIKETDYDAPYKFDWGDVLKLIQNRGLDMDNYYFEILRGNSDKGTSWAIVWEKEDKTGLRVINIDGITGKITREAALEYPSDE